MVKHIMLLKIVENDDTTENLDQIKDGLLAVSDEVSGLVNAEAGYNYSDSDYDLIFTATFKNPTALKRFQSNPKYLKLKEFITSVVEDETHLDYMMEAENVVDKSDVAVPEKKTAAQKKNNTVNKASKPAAKPAKATPKTAKAPVKPVVKEIAKEEPVKKAIVKPEPAKEVKKTEPVVSDVVKPKLSYVPVTPVCTDENASEDNKAASSDKPVYTTYSEDIKVTPIYDKDNAATDETVNKSSAAATDDDIVIKRIEPKGTQIKDGESAMEEAWKCPACGKINGNFVGLCGCGADKPSFYVPLTPEEVEQARLEESPEISGDALPLLKNNILLPPIDELVNNIKPTITKTVNAIKKSAGEDIYDDEKETTSDEKELTVVQKAAANLESEEQIDVIRIEPKGKQIRDGESAMEDAWRCPVCSKINGAFVGICGCGVHRPDNYTPVPIEEIQAEEEKHKHDIANHPEKKVSAKNSADAYEQLIHDKKNAAIKNLTDTLTNVKNKGLQTLTDAMNNAEITNASSDNSNASTKKKAKKEPGYNTKLLSSDEEETETIHRIEPKGSQPKSGESAMRNSWVCPKCGKQNASYIGQCGCGCQKSLTKEFA